MAIKKTYHASSDEHGLEPADEKQLDKATGGFIWGALAGAGFLANVWSDGRNASATTAKNSSILEQADALREEAQQRKAAHESKCDLMNSDKELESAKQGIDPAKYADYLLQVNQKQNQDHSNNSVSGF